MAKLTPNQKIIARSFLNDLFIAGGILTASDSKQKVAAGHITNYIREYAATSAAVVCRELLYREFEFFNVDKALEDVATTTFYATLTPNVSIEHPISKKPEMLAKYIADFCNENGIFWDDINTNRTKIELQQYRETSILGKACWEFKCFLSQQSSNNIRQTSGTAVNTPRTPGQPPQNNYKSSGPQSINARALLGTPGEKLYLGRPATALEFDKQGASIPCLFVDPIGKKGSAKGSIAAGTIVGPIGTRGSVTVGTLNKVMEGTAKGYTDCEAYFADTKDADDFLAKYVQSHNLTPQVDPDTGVMLGAWDSQKYIGLRARTAKVNPNGYFRVDTDCGECYISATKLNEALTTDQLDEAKNDVDNFPTKDEIKQSHGYYDIGNINIYEKE